MRSVMADNNSDNLAAGETLYNPSTSQQNMDVTFDDDHSVANSASTLQMSMLESRMESEMTKMSKMVKDTVSCLTEHMNQKLREVDTKFNNLLSDLIPTSHNTNVNSSDTQPLQSNVGSGDTNVSDSSPSKGDNSHFKMKPQTFNGASDFEEFLSQYEITCEINGWQYREKSLYLANCLTGDARSVLSELDHDGKRDYNTLVEKLANRFGSVNRSEIYRAQLKTRVRNKGESIPELAQAVKKLVRQAYPGVTKEVIETLSVDNFIDALTDSEIRLRVRELGPKTLADAERTALRLESHKIADKQRSRLVGQIDADKKLVDNQEKGESNKQLKALENSLELLTKQVNDLKSQNRSHKNNMFTNFRSQGNSSRYNRSPQSNPPPSNSNQSRHAGFNRSNNFRPNRIQADNHNQPAQRLQADTNGFVQKNRGNYARQFNENNVRNENNQGNWNQSVWGATTRRH